MASDISRRVDGGIDELAGFVAEIRSGIALVGTDPNSYPGGPVDLYAADRDTLTADLAVLTKARATGRTIDQIMQQSPAAIKVLDKYGVHTTMNVARTPGNVWTHHQREVGIRTLGKMATRLRVSLGGLSEYAGAVAPKEKVNRAERKRRALESQKKMAVLAANAYGATIEMRVDDPGVTEAKVAKRGHRKGKIVDGTVVVDRSTYIVPKEKARLLAHTLQGTMRAMQIDHIHPVFVDVANDPDLRKVELGKPTE